MPPAGFEAVHEEYGGTVGTVGGRPVARRYRRPARTHRAVRNGVGVIELPFDVLRVTGDRRRAALGGVLDGPVPGTEGAGRYALHLADGRIAADAYVYNAGERVLAFLAPGTAPTVTEALDAAGVDVERTDLTVFGIHGPDATEKVASVLNRTGTPEDRLSFVRGRIADVGVSVVRTDAPAGEPGYDVVCAPEHRETLFDTLLNRGLNAVPVGWETWLALTLEAGTPLFHTELAGRPPEVLGLEGPDSTGPGDTSEGDRLTGVSVPAGTNLEAGATVRDADGAAVGTVTRSAASPLLDRRPAFAVLPAPAPERLRITVEGSEVPARVESLPFHGGTEPSGRCPRPG